jgi:hypothetical protein
MTSPNSVATFLNPFSVTVVVVSSELMPEGRVEMSMGVRIMGFRLQRVGWVRALQKGQRQNMAAVAPFCWIQQFAHQFWCVNVKNGTSTLAGMARDLLQGVEKPTPYRLV